MTSDELVKEVVESWRNKTSDEKAMLALRLRPGFYVRQDEVEYTSSDGEFEVDPEKPIYWNRTP